MLNKQDFLDAGYNDFSESFLLQKKIFNDKGDIKYFINAYDPEKYKKDFDKLGISELPSFTIKIYFYRGIDTFLLEIFANKEHTIEYIENLAEEFYQKMDMETDKHN